jgi:Eukaryotic translation initiation factor 3 subunit 8 N-terminus
VLVHIYFKAIHDQFHSARDSLLMSHLQVRSICFSSLIRFSFRLLQPKTQLICLRMTVVQMCSADTWSLSK